MNPDLPQFQVGAGHQGLRREDIVAEADRRVDIRVAHFL